METVSYKTNICNETALKRVSPFLNKAVGIANWQLDLTVNDRTLTVFSSRVVNETLVSGAVHKAGFRAVNIEDYYAIY